MPSATPLSGRQPHFDRLRTALMCGKPDCVPALELFHDIEVKEAFLGRPVLSIADDVEFHYAAGYDYYNAWVGYEGIRQRIAVDLVKPVTVTGSPYKQIRPRRWPPERGGLITSLEDFEAFPWPRP